MLTLVTRYGDKGAIVSYIQKLLYDLGNKIVVDGIYGSQTKKTVAAFQKEKKKKKQTCCNGYGERNRTGFDGAGTDKCPCFSCTF